MIRFQSMALEKLSKMLTLHYGEAPITIVDEYDTPIQEGHSKDFYEEIIGFMRNFFSGLLKIINIFRMGSLLVSFELCRRAFSAD